MIGELKMNKHYYVVAGHVAPDGTVKFDHADTYYFDYQEAFPHGSILEDAELLDNAEWVLFDEEKHQVEDFAVWTVLRDRLGF